MTNFLQVLLRVSSSLFDFHVVAENAVHLLQLVPSDGCSYFSVSVRTTERIGLEGLEGASGD